MIVVIKSAYNLCDESSTHVCAKVTKKRRQGVLIEKNFLIKRRVCRGEKCVSSNSSRRNSAESTWLQ
ncbi:hypothetical protein L6D_04800 [Enterococcus faecalis]|nr:hypothetical protein L6D_04800 [Enterococcus faecalis]